jgi:hypothetical protein
VAQKLQHDVSLVFNGTAVPVTHNDSAEKVLSLWHRWRSRLEQGPAETAAPTLYSSSAR